jgi:hypothetical protein
VTSAVASSLSEGRPLSSGNWGSPCGGSPSMNEKAGSATAMGKTPKRWSRWSALGAAGR